MSGGGDPSRRKSPRLYNENDHHDHDHQQVLSPFHYSNDKESISSTSLPRRQKAVQDESINVSATAIMVRTSNNNADGDNTTSPPTSTSRIRSSRVATLLQPPDNAVTSSSPSSSIITSLEQKFDEVVNLNISEHNHSFPWILHEMLETAEAEGMSHIVSWLPHGLSFRVHKPIKFETTLMKRFFKQTKFKSFQRQLSVYRFIREKSGPEKGSYKHPLFTKQKKFQTLKMRRSSSSSSSSSKQVNIGDGQETTSSTTNEMLNHDASTLDASSSIGGSTIGSLRGNPPQSYYNSAPSGDSTIQEYTSAARSNDDVNTIIIKYNNSLHSSIEAIPTRSSVVTTARTTSEQTTTAARRTSSVAATTTSAPPGEGSSSIIEACAGATEEDIGKRSRFPRQLYNLLEDIQRNKKSNSAEGDDEDTIIGWDSSGTSVEVYNSKKLTESIFPKYFGKIKYKSFQRQLLCYGFSRTSIGVGQSKYHHPMFQRHRPDLITWIARQKQERVGRERTLKSTSSNNTTNHGNKRRKSKSLEPDKMSSSSSSSDATPQDLQQRAEQESRGMTTANRGVLRSALSLSDVTKIGTLAQYAGSKASFQVHQQQDGFPGASSNPPSSNDHQAARSNHDFIFSSDDDSEEEGSLSSFPDPTTDWLAVFEKVVKKEEEVAEEAAVVDHHQDTAGDVGQDQEYNINHFFGDNKNLKETR